MVCRLRRLRLCLLICKKTDDEDEDGGDEEKRNELVTRHKPRPGWLAGSDSPPPTPPPPRTRLCFFPDALKLQTATLRSPTQGRRRNARNAGNAWTAPSDVTTVQLIQSNPIHRSTQPCAQYQSPSIRTYTYSKQYRHRA